MNENQTAEAVIVRPTKKQQELLSHIERFIAEHGYSPSYREIMNALQYNSVATVALHVGNLIKRGHLVKRGRSARSLEVVKHETAGTEPTALPTNQVKPDEGKWLVDEVSRRLNQAEETPQIERAVIDDLYILVGALGVLGLEGAAQSFLDRLSVLKERLQAEPA